MSLLTPTRCNTIRFLHAIARTSTVDKTQTDVEEVRDFYKDRAVFVTGATGLVGKVLVEKLLWSCPDIKAIYLLLRPKKNEDAKIRSAKIMGLPIFDRLRSERPNDIHKIIPVAGDLTEPGLGLSRGDRELLNGEVSVVFHSAANINFNEKLKVAMSTNLVGTKRVAELCRSTPGLEAFVHVSSAYTNCNRKEICEEVYPPPYDPDKAMQLVDAMEDEIMENISPLILSRSNLPNTYTFAKAMTEGLLAYNYSDLPLDIVRPSIVTSSLKEPVPGWVDGDAAQTQLLAFAERGGLRVLPSKHNLVVDMIPVDMVANCMLCAAWRRVVCPPEVTPLVYNICSGSQNPLSYGDYIRSFNEFRSKNSTEPVAHSKIYLQSNDVFYRVLASVLESFPAYISDAYTRLSSGQPKYVRYNEKKNAVISNYKYFWNREWKFTDNNVRDLLNLLSADDRKAFPFDVKKIHWHYYVETVVLGFRKFLLKQQKRIQ